MATRIRPPAALGLALAAGLALAGCGKNKDGDTSQPAAPQQPTMPPGPPPEEVLAKLPGGDEFAAGKKVYAHNSCANCHKLGETGRGGMRPPGGPGGAGPGGPPGGPPGGAPGGMGGGPDLTTTGANPEHTSRWLADHVRDPKAHKPQSRMPAYGPDKIGDADLTALGDYLASRK